MAACLGEIRRNERGSVLLSAVLVLAVAGMTAMALAGISGSHYKRARHEADRMAARELARAGALHALIALARTPGSSGSVSWSEGPPGNRGYTANWNAAGTGYTITSTGAVPASAAQAVVEVGAWWPILTAWGTITLSHGGLGGNLAVNGDILSRNTAADPDMTVTAGATAGALTVNGNLATEGGVTLSAGVGSSLNVNGHVTSSGATESGAVVVRGSKGPPNATSALPAQQYVGDQDYESRYQALVPCSNPPPLGDVTVTGDQCYTAMTLVGRNLTVDQGATAVIDGDLSVTSLPGLGGTLTVNGTLYVRGKVDVTALDAPPQGSGTVVARGSITVNTLHLIGLAQPGASTLKVLAVKPSGGAGGGDITIQGVGLLGSGNAVSGLLLYTDTGKVDVSMTAPPDTVSLCAVAGGDLSLQVNTVPLAATSIQCDEAAWQGAPLPLQNLRFETARTWWRVVE